MILGNQHKEVNGRKKEKKNETVGEVQKSRNKVNRKTRFKAELRREIDGKRGRYYRKTKGRRWGKGPT